MNESTPLIDYLWNKKTRYTIYISTGLISIIILYLFTIVLPNYYIPKGIELKEITKIKELEISLIPHDHKPVKDRLILIGDVHGHYNEFRKLLSKVEYNSKKDHVLLLGDFITKGPDNFKMLDYLIEHNIDCILGNHEYYVLQNYATFHGFNQPTVKNFNDPEFLLAKKLQPKHINYINNCSIIKDLGHVPNGKGIAVHAGILWTKPLNEQNPIDNLEMRSLIAPFYNETTNDPTIPKSKSWSKLYNKQYKQGLVNYIVYYGHAASRGLDLKKYTKGLDSGCDKGQELTAMIIKKNKEEIIQVKC